MIIVLMSMVLREFVGKQFIEQLTKWEFDISVYERVPSERLPELRKTTLLVTKTNGAMYRCLCMQIDDLASSQKT